MDEAKMSGTRVDEDDPWLMDDSCPYGLADLEDFSLSKEVEERLEALANEIFGPVDEVQSAA